MRCSSCGAENPEGLKFCNECAAPLKRRCGACGFENAPSAKFCGECAAPLNALFAPPDPANAPAAQALRVTAEADSQTITDGERKTITALFADIKGSMELMEDLDPEEARAIVDPALRLMIDAVHRYDGYIVQSTGDGIFALFGAPVAHEDHPQRALYAALRMQEEMRRYSAKLRTAGNPPIEARVGINTGEVVVRFLKTGEGHAEYTPIGHSTSLASRMQTLAPTGSIATTGQVKKLCEGYFVFKDLGPARVKGVGEPVSVYEVTGLGPLRTRLQIAARRGLTRFVGREAELAQMRRALELARQGRGQIVAAMGEAGVGKSRLFFEFKAVAQSGCIVLEAYSVSHGKAFAYLPIIDLLKSYFKIAAEDDERARREKVAGKVVILDRTLEDTLPYLYALLGINENDDQLAPLDAQTRRRRTLEAIKRILVRESLSQPLIVVLEDLHWVDSETQALLNLLVDGIATARILLLVNYRPEYHHQWGNKTYYTQLRLDPLGKDSADEMLSALLASPAPAALPAGANRERPTVRSEAEDGRVRVPDGIDALKRLIIARTEGNPFFMEEMVQALFEQGVLARNGAVKLAKPLNEIRVPPTVQAILASRIDRLAVAEKELLQTLAVLGREFSSGLIKRVVGKSDDELERMLSALQVAEFIYEQPAMGDVEYTFKHALTLEVAYSSVLAQRRRLLHERAAQAIEALFSDRVEDHLPELAHHYDRSGNARKAVEYLGRAGIRAAQQTAHSEAVGYFTRALELLETLPVSADRAPQELGLRMAMSWSVAIAKGPGTPERGALLVRMRELCEQLGDKPRLVETLLALAHFHYTRRERGLGQELASRVLALAEGSDAQNLASAHFLVGWAQFTVGELRAARKHTERAHELFGPGPFRNSAEVEYARLNAGILAMVLATLGYPATAVRTSAEKLAAARRLSDPVSLAGTLAGDLFLHLNIRDSSVVIEQAQELFSMSMDLDMPFLLAMATFARGWALVAQKRAEEGIAEMRRGMTMLESSGGGAVRTPMSGWLAEACGNNGLPQEGLAMVSEELARMERTGARDGEATQYWLKGDLLLIEDPSNQAEAERCFRTAIEIARRQEARLRELGATASLARLLKRQGKTGEARTMLAEIYNWFTEGFEFADLKEAKALLEELGA